MLLVVAARPCCGAAPLCVQLFQLEARAERVPSADLLLRTLLPNDLYRSSAVISKFIIKLQ